MTSTLASIAVVDDDDGIRSALRQLLRTAAFDVLTFASAEEFLDFSARERVVCVIADVNLPGMSGVALLQALAAAGLSVPAVLITARDDPLTRELIGRAGTVPRLRKPFGATELLDAIQQALRS
jgi:FixJ family two-component response regulator